MDLLDFIKELRNGDPDIEKAQKAMKILGWICVIGALWNFTIYFVVPFNKSPFNLPSQYPYLALASLLPVGALFFCSSQGIGKMVTWGKKTGQIAIISLFGVFLGFMLFVFPIKAFSQHDHIFWGVFFFFATVLVVQLIVAYLGIRYLARLPAKEKNLSTAQCKSQERSMVDQINNECKMSQRHKEALLPFGIMGTFAIILVLFIFAMSIGEKYVAPHLPFPFGIFFILIFFGPPSYNYLPSSFQKERDIIASSTGGGSIFLFHGCWPFFRLIAYKDGVEVRFMFHRFFIPYNKINEIPSEVSFFTRGILIKSDLPDVPSDIRFSGFGMKKIVGAINEAKREYLRGTK